MLSLKDSFELEECRALLSQLLPPGGVDHYPTLDGEQPAPAPGELTSDQALFAPTGSPPQASSAPASPPQQAPADQEPVAALEHGHTAERLENALHILCQRGGFSSAIIADDQGLALADYNSPVDTDVLAAFATVLGGAIAQASHFLEQHEANNISMDINYTDKAVVRKFTINATPFYLFIICPQAIDERNEVELSLVTITKLLER